MRAVCVWLGVAVALLLAGCANGTPAASGPSTSPAPESTTATPAPTPTQEPSATAPDNGIPADLVLPGQADGSVEPKTDAGRLYDHICLDPQEQWTLGTGFVEAQTVVLGHGPREGATTIEKLTAYPSVEQAVEAVRGLRTQVALCGDELDHVGNPTSWRSTELTSFPAADEAVQLTHRSKGAVSAVVTVARVGRAVFYVDRREQYDGVRLDRSMVAGFIPTLAEEFR